MITSPRISVPSDSKDYTVTQLPPHLAGSTHQLETDTLSEIAKDLATLIGSPRIIYAAATSTKATAAIRPDITGEENSNLFREDGDLCDTINRLA